ncbi:hypothetical protein DRE_04078 [Drechslerella stenobrocha 248]|uniref:Endonuclease III homolog n=1 Tax=Drechslerella stenobrocha 248 TaxID=1043628 RepID=W7HRD0_9PEZI|nr:hypothetical protein DRE_04078 [Drechslerella stenobrocha 248]
MRSAKSRAAQKIRTFSNPTTTTQPKRARTSASTTTIVSKLPASRNRANTSRAVKREDEDPEVQEPSEESELSSAPSDLESAYSEAAASDDEEEYTASPYFPPPSRPSRKRKRAAGPAAVKDEDSSDDIPEPKPKPAKRTPAKPKRKNGEPIEIRYDPPDNWREFYDAIKEMRLRIPAPVDTVGCARLAQTDVPPVVKRFQHLIALMMSSQTKDQVTGDAMRRLQTELPGGLTLESILAVAPARLNEMIGQVGFHNRKTEYIKKAAVVLRDKFGGDIPSTIEDMMSLDGVGPKMSYLLEQCAWGRSSGIGVDVHVHRIANMFKWVPASSEPETTRIYLQSWLPRDLWTEINWLLVGFGQSVCLPRGRRCDICTLGPKSTGGNGACKAGVVVKGKTIKREIVVKQEIKQEVKVEEDGEGSVVKKEEEGVEPGPAWADAASPADPDTKAAVKEEQTGDEDIVVKKEEVVEDSVLERTDPLGMDPDVKVAIKEETTETQEFPVMPDIEDAVGRPRRNIRRKR